jgi:hypothetical protein
MPTLAAAVPQVDVVHDGFDRLTLIFGAAGVVAAIVAIVIAVRAQRSIADERRRQFELEILRQILAEVEDGNLLDEIEFKPGKVHRFRRRLMLIENPPPYWVTVMSADWYADLVPDRLRRQEEVSVEHAAAVNKAMANPDNADLWAEVERHKEELAILADGVRASVPRRLLNELEEAIRGRVDARHQWWRRDR